MSRDQFKNYKVTLVVKTPVHIGGSPDGEINKTGYIYDKNTDDKNTEKNTDDKNTEKNTEQIHVINQQKWIKYLTGRNQIDQFANYISQSIGNKQINRVDLLTWIKKNCRFSPNQLKDLYRISFSTKHIQSTVNDISLFTRNVYDDIYIPGSSIKGSIRNAVLITNILKKNLGEKYWDRITGNKEIAIEIEKEIFGDKNPIGITISDTFEGANIKTYISQDIDYNLRKKTDRKMPKFREYLQPESELTFYLKIDTYYSEKIGINSIEDIFKKIRESSIFLFEKGGLSNIEEINKFLPEGYENYLILGSNTGYHQKTVLDALAPNRKELLEATKKILHKKDGDKISSHKNDKVYSPRVLNLTELSGKQYLSGFVELKYIEV